jgi:hypothetical protein
MKNVFAQIEGKKEPFPFFLSKEGFNEMLKKEKRGEFFVLFFSAQTP